MTTSLSLLGCLICRPIVDTLTWSPYSNTERYSQLLLILLSRKTPRYCWRTYCHAIQSRWLRWILQVPVPSTTAEAQFSALGGSPTVSGGFLRHSPHSPHTLTPLYIVSFGRDAVWVHTSPISPSTGRASRSLAWSLVRRSAGCRCRIRFGYR